MVTVDLSKAAAIETKKFLLLLITQTIDLHTRLWKVFKFKEKEKGNLITIGANNRPLETIKPNVNVTLLSIADFVAYLCICIEVGYFGGQIG